MATIKALETKKVKIDATAEGGEVEVLTSITARDLDTLAKHKEELNSVGFMLAFLIKGWNLTDSEGKALPINETTVQDIVLADVNNIIEESGIKSSTQLEGKA